MSVRKDALEHRLAEELRRLQRQRHAQALAPALLLALGCTPAGVDLLWWLEEPGARNNQDALSLWIQLQLADEDFRAERALQPEQSLLLGRLEGVLACRDAANDACWGIA